MVLFPRFKFSGLLSCFNLIMSNSQFSPGWFDYKATGPDFVKVHVSFHPNRDFDDYRYFERHGSIEDLTASIEEMQMEVRFLEFKIFLG